MGTIDAFQRQVWSPQFKQNCFPHRSKMGVLKSFPGRAAKIIEKSSERRLAIAAEEGRHRREQEERQLAKRMKKAKKRIAKIERKIEELKRRNKDAFS